MALILDDCIRSTASNPLPDNLVHSYNKRCFQNYEVAEETLTNKVLLPGEVAFAYYYDLLSPYGQNAIAAVGPLTHGTGNIIFKNSLLIESIREDLMITIAYVNASINYLREDLNTDLDNAINHLDSSLNEIWELFINTDTIYNTSINNIINELHTSNTSIMNVFNASCAELNDLITNNHTELSTLINNVSNGLYTKIEDTSNYIVNYIIGKINEGFGGASSETDDKINGMTTSLSDIIENFKKEFNDKIEVLDSSLTLDMSSIHHRLDEMQMGIDTIKRAYEEMWHFFVHMDGDSDIKKLISAVDKLNDINLLLNRIDVLETLVKALTSNEEQTQTDNN